MNGAHQTLDDAKLVVDDFGERSEAVRSARSIGNLTMLSEKKIERIYLWR